jgi:hypothetical protein
LFEGIQILIIVRSELRSCRSFWTVRIDWRQIEECKLFSS